MPARVFGSIVVVDNYDSFTWNLVQQLERLSGERLSVVRNDAFEPEALLAARPRAIVISPGPGTPARAGRCIELIRLNRDIPLLGVCLGHQAIAEAFGAKVVRGALPVHGKVSEVRHSEANLFAGCPHPMLTARYHSLVVARETLPDVLQVDAETGDGAIMAISHRDRPVYGIQFHPESYGTEGGDRLIENFLLSCHPALQRGIPSGGTTTAPSAGDPSTALGMTREVLCHPERREGSQNATAEPFGDPSPSARLRMTGEVSCHPALQRGIPSGGTTTAPSAGDSVPSARHGMTREVRP